MAAFRFTSGNLVLNHFCNYFKLNVPKIHNHVFVNAHHTPIPPFYTRQMFVFDIYDWNVSLQTRVVPALFSVSHLLNEDRLNSSCILLSMLELISPLSATTLNAPNFYKYCFSF